jgi:hypothetical protein
MAIWMFQTIAENLTHTYRQKQGKYTPDPVVLFEGVYL